MQVKGANLTRSIEELMKGYHNGFTSNGHNNSR